MKKRWVETFKIKINNDIAEIDVACFDSERFVCLFNKEEHRDFRTEFKALGFKVAKTSLGDYQTDFFPIKLSHTSPLTKEIMSNIWAKIEKVIESKKIRT